MPRETSEKDFIEFLVNNKTAFDDFVYTPWKIALDDLNSRQNDPGLDKYLRQTLPINLPDCLMTGHNMALARNVATPNYEMYRFMLFADVFKSLKPVILGYKKDKFVNVSEMKYALGNLCFYKGVDVNNKPILEYLEIIDKDVYEGKSIDTIKTFWGEPLHEFHSTFLTECIPGFNLTIYDLSEMCESLGSKAKFYYKTALSLFLRNTILFENYLFNSEELPFIEKIVLPTIIQIMKETGKKPLIINLGPSQNEDDIFWLSYPPHKKPIVDRHIKNFSNLL